MLRPSFRKLIHDDNWSEVEETTTEDEVMMSSGEADKSKNRNDSKWDSDRSAYEMQLNQLQEQLVATMVENHQLGEELKVFKEKSTDVLVKELEDERKRTKKLEEQLKKMKPKRPPMPPSESKKKDQCQESNDPDLAQGWEDLGKEGTDGPSSGIAAANNVACFIAQPRLNDDAGDNGSKDFTESGSNRQSKFGVKYLEWKISIWNLIHERVSDFILDEAEDEVEEEEEPLAIRTTLRENVSRFTEGIRPISRFVKGADGLFTWQNPWLTLSAFGIYMYSVWLGYALQLFLFLLIVKLSKNYIYARGIAQKFGYNIKNQSGEEENKDEPITSWSERYQLVLQVARKVQNKLGFLADGLEKFENLFCWEHEEASKKLYTALWMVFITSFILSTRFFFFFLGIGLGIKMFIITPIYKKFPKVKDRYDDTARLWEELPTHKERDARKELKGEAVVDGVPAIDHRPMAIEGDSEVPSRPGSGMSGEGDDLEKSPLTWEAIMFCDRFALSQTEIPLEGWQEGRRCTVMNKESPLSNMKHGRLYLTKNYLCFERNQFHSKKNFAIRLQEITKLEKTKPFSFIPGVGMSVEVTVKGVEKPYLFAAMMGRDEAYDSIIRAARTLNLSWGRKSP